MAIRIIEENGGEVSARDLLAEFEKKAEALTLKECTEQIAWRGWTVKHDQVDDVYTIEHPRRTAAAVRSFLAEREFLNALVESEPHAVDASRETPSANGSERDRLEEACRRAARHGFVVRQQLGGDVPFKFQLASSGLTLEGLEDVLASVDGGAA